MNTMNATYTVRWDDGTESVLTTIQAIEDAAYDRRQRGDVWLTSERYGPDGECIPLFQVGDATDMEIV